METVSLTQKKKTCKVPYSGTQLTFSGAFDSGNLNWAGADKQKDEIQLLFGKDRDIKPSSRCWFYFSIEGNYQYLPVKLLLMKVNSLTTVSKIYDLYRPVIRVQGGQWERHEYPVEFQITPDNDINFRMTVDLHDSKKVQIALCYPWSFTDNENYLNALDKELKHRKDVYFNKEVLIYSNQKRPVQLIAISSPDVCSYPPEEFSEHLFPNRQTENHFKIIKKPLILITARVHPGEIGSSYALNGVIEFLISGTDEARKILNQFYFLIVPILNPDGVCNGNNRMDSLGQNLNRFYHLPDLEKQPSCYAIKTLVENTRRQIFAFFDFHGHANKKSCFLFGNSINSTKLQADSVLFAKYLSSICDHIEFKSCNFSKKQMSSKDKNQESSKQGCARVVVHRWTNSPYCYTLETGLYKNVKVDQKGIERYGDKFYSPETYMQVGAKMVISLFAILRKTKSLQEMKKSVAIYVGKLEKLNNKKQKEKPKEKEVMKKEVTMKDLNKEVVRIQVKKIKSEKENQYNEDKAYEIQQIFQKNKHYLLSLEMDDELDD